MNNQPKKPLKKKDKLARMISKLNILEKLLNQPMVSVRKALGDSELVDEVNKELKAFIQQQMDFIFNPESIQPISAFTDPEVLALKELAESHIEASASVVRTPVVPVPVEPVAPSAPEKTAPKPPPVGKSHVQTALLESYGIDVTDPNVSMLDKATAMRKLEADNRKKNKKKE